MLMRGFVVLLLLLNAAALAWQWELFAPWGWAPQTAREPERVLNQIRPELIRVETPAVTAKRLIDEAALVESAMTEAAQAEKSETNADALTTTTASAPTVNVSVTNSPSPSDPVTATTPKLSAQAAPPSPAVLKPPAALPAANVSKPAKLTAP